MIASGAPCGKLNFTGSRLRVPPWRNFQCIHHSESPSQALASAVTSAMLPSQPWCHWALVLLIGLARIPGNSSDLPGNSLDLPGNSWDWFDFISAKSLSVLLSLAGHRIPQALARCCWLVGRIVTIGWSCMAVITNGVNIPTARPVTAWSFKGCERPGVQGSDLQCSAAIWIHTLWLRSGTTSPPPSRTISLSPCMFRWYDHPNVSFRKHRSLYVRSCWIFRYIVQNRPRWSP